MCRGAVLIALYCIPSCLDKAIDRQTSKYKFSADAGDVMSTDRLQFGSLFRPGDDYDEDRGCVQESNRNWVITHKLRFVL